MQQQDKMVFHKLLNFLRLLILQGLFLQKWMVLLKGWNCFIYKDQLNIPVKFIGLGEQVDDLQEFDLEQYIYGLCKGLVEEA